MTKFRHFAGVFVGGLLLSLSAVCRAAGPTPPVEPHRMGPLSPGDSVSVQVSGQQEVDAAYVGDDGTISLPLVGNVQVAGATPVEAGARVAKALKDGGYFLDPHVTVTVTQPRSLVVSVLGEVQMSGRYPISPRTTIVDLLAQAGGMKETASDVGYVLRTDDSGHVSRYPVKLSQLTDISEGQPALRFLDGDSLVVPRAEHFSVLGEVASPGRYSIESGMTVMEGLARAGGITERGSERRIELKRRGKDGQYQVIHVKTGDLIQADDIIRVKESIF